MIFRVWLVLYAIRLIYAFYGGNTRSYRFDRARYVSKKITTTSSHPRVTFLLRYKKKELDPISASDGGGCTAEAFDVSGNGITYEVELSRRPGIDWGTDLSFRWVYVTAMDPNGDAAKSNLVAVGDYIIGIGNSSTIAADFDFVLTSLVEQKTERVKYTFFRGRS